MSTSARLDLAAHSAAIRLEPAVLVKELRELLGARLVAYLGGVRETRAVRQWAEGTRSIGRGRDLSRLRGWATRPRSCWLSGTIRRWCRPGSPA